MQIRISIKNPRMLWMLIFCVSATLSHAAGTLLTDPILMENQDGELVYTRQPIRWPDDAVDIEVEADRLGSLTVDETVKLVSDTIGDWNAISAARLIGLVTGRIEVEKETDPITVENYSRYIPPDLTGATPDPDRPELGSNNVIIDNEGDIIDEILGENASTHILGLSSVFTTDVGDIISGYCIINGAVVANVTNSTSTARFMTIEQTRSTICHEIGHLFGLDHSQLFTHLALNEVIKDDQYLPVMLPISGDDDSQRATPRFDDQQALTMNYPLKTVNVPTIYGTIMAGTREVFNANIVARHSQARNATATSIVSDYLFNQKGEFIFQNLPLGEYEVYVEPIDPRFTTSSLSTVGPYYDIRVDTDGEEVDEDFIDEIVGSNKWTPVYAEYFNGIQNATDEYQYDEYSSVTDDRVSFTRIPLTEDLNFAVVNIEVPVGSPPETEDSAQILALDLFEQGGVGSATESTPIRMSETPFLFEILDTDPAMRIELQTEDSNRPLWLYVAYEAPYSDDNANAATTPEPRQTNEGGAAVITLASSTVTQLVPGTYFITVGNPNEEPVAFQIKANKSLGLPIGIPVMSETVLAGLNKDATTDNLGSFWPDNTQLGTLEGNLVGTSQARMFQHAVADGTTTVLEPLYDPNLSGSLLRFNMEPGDPLILSSIVNNITKSVVSELAAALPGTATRAALVADLTETVFAEWIGPASLGVISAVTHVRYPPTDVFAADNTFAASEETLIYVWDGRVLDWTVGNEVISASEAIADLVIVSSTIAPEFIQYPYPVGVDLYGPVIPSATDASRDFVVSPTPEVIAGLRVRDGINPYVLDLTKDATAIVTEFSPGDVLWATAVIDVSAELDGEEQFEGDRLSLRNVNVNFNKVGGDHFITNDGITSTDPFGLKGEAFIDPATSVISLVTEESVAGVTMLLATGIVGEFQTGFTEGDYSYLPLIFSATDDVADALIMQTTIRVDAVPATVVEVTAQTSEGGIVNASGILTVNVGEVVIFNATIDLGGDPFDAQSRPVLTGDFRALDTDMPAVPPAEFLASEIPDLATAVFEVFMASNAQSNEAAGIIFTVTDDAGNIAITDSRSLGITLNVVGRTGFVMEDGNAIAGALNRDATDDLLIREGPFGSAALRQAGDLVSVVTGSNLFSELIDDVTNNNLRLLYDREMTGSLIDANLEVGDTLVFSATVTSVTEELVTTLISEPIGNATFMAALNEVTPQVAMRLLPGTPFDIDGVTDTSILYFPNSATGVHPAAIYNATSLILTWDGSAYDPPLILSATSTTTDSMAAVEFFPTDVTTAFNVKGSPLGIDLDGPAWVGDVTSGIIQMVTAIRPANPLLNTPERLLVSATTTVPDDFQFIPGDQLILSASLAPFAYSAGEIPLIEGTTDSVATQIFGATSRGADALRLSDISVDLSSVGATLPFDDSAIVEKALLPLPTDTIDVSALYLDAEIRYQIEAVLGGATTVVSDGDFDLAPIIFQATDDVNPPVFAEEHIRFDALPPMLTNLVFNTAQNDGLDFGGVHRTRLFPGDAVEMIATIDLLGDAFVAGQVPLVTADISSLVPGSTAVEPDTLTDNGDGTVQAVFNFTVAADAEFTLEADIGLILVDDAENAVQQNSSDLGIYAMVGTGIPVVQLSAVAGLNADATPDNLGRFGDAGTPEALAAGNLVGSIYAPLFVTPTVDAANENRAPLFDENLPGSLVAANAESGDPVLVAIQVANVIPSLVAALAAAEPGSVTYSTAASEVLSLVNLYVDPVAIDAPAGVTAGVPIAPHAVLPAPSTDPLAAESLIFVWDGRIAETPWIIGAAPASSSELVEFATVVATLAPEQMSISAGGLGIDTLGPQWQEAQISASRLNQAGEVIDLDTEEVSGDGVVLQEMILGDTVILSAQLVTGATDDGEAAEFGDPLALDDVRSDYSAILDSADQTDEAFLYTDGILVPVQSATGTVIYSSTATIGRDGPIVTTGDFDQLPILLTAQDDVLNPVTAEVFIRIDTVPALVQDVTTSTLAGLVPDASGALAVSVGDVVLVTVTVDLGGDPFNSSPPTVVLDAGAFDIFATSILPDSLAESGADAAQAVFAVTITETARQNDAAQISITITDDAGNVTGAFSGDFGFVYDVQGRTGFDVAEGDVIAAALNSDSASDLFARLGSAGSEELRGNGDLVATDYAPLFQRVVDDPANGNLAPLYDPALLGSLIDANLEVGDVLVVAATISHVTPELAETIRSASVESATYQAAVAEVARNIALVPTMQLGVIIDTLTADSRVIPTDVTGTAADYPESATTLIVVWDGTRTDPPLNVSNLTVPTDPHVVVRAQPTDIETDLSQPATPLGADLLGPVWTQPASGEAMVQLNSAVRPADGVFNTENRELLTGDALQNAEVQFSPADILEVSGFLVTNVFIDGEFADPGDALMLDDVAASFAALGGSDGLTGAGAERFIALEGVDVFDPADLPLTATEAHYLASGVLGTASASGDYVNASIVLTVTDDVGIPNEVSLDVRYDPLPVLPVSFEVGTIRGATTMIDGQERLQVEPGEVLNVTVTVDLNGDAYVDQQTPLARLDTTAFVESTGTIGAIEMSEIAPGIVQAVFSVPVSDRTWNDDSVSVPVYVRDDAGNVALIQSGDFDKLISITGALKEGDFNQDGTVDNLDVILLSVHWMEEITEGLEIYDLIPNGLIDRADLIRLWEIINGQ